MLMWLAAPCQNVKDHTACLAGLFQPVEPPTTWFSDYTMDFIFGLPIAAGFISIMTVVDRANKCVVLTPVHDSITAPHAADLFLQYIVRIFCMPKCIFSDHDPLFMSHFWQHLFCHLGTCLLHSSANHPQMDGQIKRAISLSRSCTAMSSPALLPGMTASSSERCASTAISTAAPPCCLIF